MCSGNANTNKHSWQPWMPCQLPPLLLSAEDSATDSWSRMRISTLPSPPQASCLRPPQLQSATDTKTSSQSTPNPGPASEQVHLAGPGPGLQLERSVWLLWVPPQRCQRIVPPLSAIGSVCRCTSIRRYQERRRCLLARAASPHLTITRRRRPLTRRTNPALPFLLLHPCIRLDTSRSRPRTIRLPVLSISMLFTRPRVVLSPGDSTASPMRWSVCRDVLTCGRIVLKLSLWWSLMRLWTGETVLLLLLPLPTIASGSAQRTAGTWLI